MALTLEDLEVVVTANTSEVTSKLSQLSSQLGGITSAGSIASTSLGGLGLAMTASNLGAQIITKAFTTVTSVFTNFTKSVVVNGTELTRIKIATNQVAQNMGITSSQVDKLRNSLSDANTFGVQAEEVIKTLAQSGLVKMANGLTAVDARTGETANSVEALVLVMKDLSAAALVESADGINRLTKFIRTGNLQFVDGIMEIGRINAAYQEFADKTGRSITQLSAEEQAQIRLNLVMTEGEKVFGAYAATMGTAGKLFQSIGQKMTQIAATIGDALSPIFNTFALGVYSLVSGIQNAIGMSTGQIANFANTIASYILAMFRTIGKVLSMIPVIGDSFKGLANLQLTAAKTANSLAKQTNNFGNAANNAADATKNLKKELAGLAGFDKMDVLTPKTSTGGASSIGNVGGVGMGATDWGQTLNIDGINSGASEIEVKINNLVSNIRNSFNSIGDSIRLAFNFMPVEGFFNMINGFVEGLKIAFAGGSIQTLFGTITMGINSLIPQIEAGLNTWKGLFNLAFSDIGLSAREFIPKIVESFSGLFTSIINDFLIPSAATIITIWGDMGANLRTIWDENGKNITDGIGLFITNIGKLFQTIWDNVLSPILTPIMKSFRTLWDDTLSGTVESVLRFVGKLIDTVLVIYNNFIVPVVGFLLKVLRPVFENTGNMIAFVFETVVSVVSGAVKGVMGFLGGLLDFIKGVFTGNWKKAFQGLSDAFSSIINGIVGIFKGVINSIIGFYNRYTDTINGITNQKWFKDIAGTLGLKVNVIPHMATLATGGLITSPTIAMMGENSKQEVVLPLDQNTGWADKVAELINKTGSNGEPINLTVKIGEDKIFDKVIDYINDKSLTTNSTILNI